MAKLARRPNHLGVLFLYLLFFSPLFLLFFFLPLLKNGGTLVGLNGDSSSRGGGWVSLGRPTAGSATATGRVWKIHLPSTHNIVHRHMIKYFDDFQLKFLCMVFTYLAHEPLRIREEATRKIVLWSCALCTAPCRQRKGICCDPSSKSVCSGRCMYAVCSRLAYVQQ